MSDAAIWWLRSPNTNNNNNVWNVNTDGSNNNNWYNNSYGVRPALMEPLTSKPSAESSAPIKGNRILSLADAGK